MVTALEDRPAGIRDPGPRRQHLRALEDRLLAVQIGQADELARSLLHICHQLHLNNLPTPGVGSWRIG